jgi:ATP-dependent RNA helicase DeaD
LAGFVADTPTPNSAGGSSDGSEKGFADLGLSPVTLEALAKAEYLLPTPVQAGLIPRALAGVDVMAQARTGTGKTAAFLIPILEGSGEPRRHNSVQALILVPTRELAVQVREEGEKLAYGRKIHIAALYGGKPIRGQIEKLRRGADIVVGTPGRVLDHLGRGTLALDDLKFVVLDEADRMLDIGFRPDIERILRRCPQSRQSLLLSATVPPPVERLARRYMREPESLNFSSQEISVETIEQLYFTVDPERKFDLLERLLVREQPKQAIVFCRTKRGTDKVYQRLAKKRVEGVACIHGDLQQNARDRVMSDFREGLVKILIATDVVGRGIDVTGISHIINYDIPQFCDDYVHRVGRTGRMGREGVAYTFVSPEEGTELTRIEMRIDRLLTRDEMPGFQAFSRPVASAAALAASPDGPQIDYGPDQLPAAEPPKPRPSPPLLGRGGRSPRRNRRAL